MKQNTTDTQTEHRQTLIHTRRTKN